jgi:glutathione S-transferase
MITLYQFKSSPLCEKVRRLLNYKGIAFDIHEVDRTKVGELKHVSPFGKFPALQDGDTPVCDSTDIVYYLEEKFPERSLVPEDPRLKAQMHIAEDWADESLYFYEVTMRLSWESNLRVILDKMMETMPATLTREQVLSLMLSGSQQLVAAQGLGRKTREQIIADVQRHIAAIATLVGEEGWMVGEAISLADLSVIAEVRCLLDAAEAREILKAYPQVSAWMARVDEVAPA